MWWRDGLLLVDSDDTNVLPPERIRLWSNGSLEVYRVQQKDTGEYKCNASRPAPWGSIIQIHAIEVMCKFHKVVELNKKQYTSENRFQFIREFLSMFLILY